MNSKKLIFSIILTFSTAISALYADMAFSGYAGAKLKYTADPEAADYEPYLSMQSFFAGQFNFTQNIWSHLEVSLDTKNLISEKIFHETDSIFRLDELSIILRKQGYYAANYFAAFLGTYDPVGSDIFLQRYFGLEPISSKITESWLGNADSILYPHFGAGIADVMKFHDLPVAGGIYAYFNHEDSKFFVFNTDARFAMTLPLFTFDIAMGIGIPLGDKYKNENVIVVIDKVYWHAGTTILIGNNYTNSIFMQAGIFNASFTAGTDEAVAKSDDIYLIFEPRLFINNFHVNFSFFSLPKNTVKNFAFIDDTFGFDLNMYTNELNINSVIYTVGSHFCVSFKDKYFTKAAESETYKLDNMDIVVAPYVSTKIGTGELHAALKLNLMEFTRTNPSKAIAIDVGYRGTF